jgi:uncharacterized protein (TIGR02145 family)
MADAADGTNEAAIVGATSSTFTMPQALFGKYIRVGITPKAAAGTTTGVEVKSGFKDGEPTTVTFSYMNNSVTFGILISEKTGRKWLDRNLGASTVPSSLTDFVNYGDLFQWGRLADGHQTITRTEATAVGVTGKTSTSDPFDYAMDTDIPNNNKFIVIGQTAPRDWRKPSNDNLWGSPLRTNNPCPEGWHVPTQEEWHAEVADNSITNLDDAFSKLNITYTGFRSGTSGNIFGIDTDAYLASSTTINTPYEHYSIGVNINNSDGYSEINVYRAAGYAVRCIKDLSQ